MCRGQVANINTKISVFVDSSSTRDGLKWVIGCLSVVLWIECTWKCTDENILSWTSFQYIKCLTETLKNSAVTFWTQNII
jgi:hypothetical protein